MHSVGYYLGISKQTEVLFLALIGICTSIFDTSLLELNVNLQDAWAITLDPSKFTGRIQFLIKYLSSGLIIFQAFSLHAYLALYIVMLWPLICEEKPHLLLPWLVLGAAKTILSGFIVFSLGLLTCSINGMFQPICADFFLSQIVKNAPPIYMWICVLSYYKELKTTVIPEMSKMLKVSIDFSSDLASRRRRARSLTEHFDEKADDGRNLLSASTIENLLRHLSSKLNSKSTTRSYDTLLQIMSTEAEKEEILNIYDDVSAVFDENISVKEKTMKLLNLSEEDIENAKLSAADRRNSTVVTGKVIKYLAPSKISADSELMGGLDGISKNGEIIKNVLALESVLTDSERRAGPISDDPFFIQFMSNENRDAQLENSAAKNTKNAEKPLDNAIDFVCEPEKVSNNTKEQKEYHFSTINNDLEQTVEKLDENDVTIEYRVKSEDFELSSLLSKQLNVDILENEHENDLEEDHSNNKIQESGILKEEIVEHIKTVCQFEEKGIVAKSSIDENEKSETIIKKNSNKQENKTRISRVKNGKIIFPGEIDVDKSKDSRKKSYLMSSTSSPFKDDGYTSAYKKAVKEKNKMADENKLKKK